MPKSLQPIIGILLFCVVSASAFAQPNAASDTEPVSTDARANTWKHFENLITTINAAKQDLNQLRKALRSAPDEGEKQRISAEIDQLSREIDSLQLAWEMWATGGVDAQLFMPKTTEKFDWREEIESVFEPILVELRRLTERPRKIERLRSEQNFYQQRLAAAESAYENIAQYKTKAPTPELADAFSGLEDRWRKRRDDLRSRLDLTNFELQELLSPSRPPEEKAKAALQTLLGDRLLNLLLAILAGASVYGLLYVLNRYYHKLVTKRGRRRSVLSRAANLVYLLIAFVLALSAGMAVLYARGDWILLGLLLLVLVAAALTLQRSLPGYLDEMRLLLNVGPVREGERVIYNGLPWRVQSLNVYTTLVNPDLRGGRLMLPVRELTGLVSRRHDDREAWFPCRENDLVLLDDDTFGRVVLQTPETVQLRVAGAIRTYPSQTFVGKCPQNLTRDGFTVAVKFGVDYTHQPTITDEIPRLFHDFIDKRLREFPVGAHLQEFSIEFDEAAASSLDCLLIASFHGEAADQFRRIRRILQKLAVEACNKNGWNIPFSQITVHMAPSISAQKQT